MMISTKSRVNMDMKILYVEDNPLDAELMQNALKRQVPPIDCRIASSLKEGREVIEQNQNFDLVLIDIMLPDGSGLELLQEIRQKELDMAAVVLTGSGDEESAVTAMKTGADDYIVKSVNYLQHLPGLFNDAINRFKNETRRRSQPLLVLYAETSIDDIDLTLRHFSSHAPHIQLDTVQTAAGVMEKLAASKERGEKYDVLLLDYRLPDRSALDLIKEIRLGKLFDLPAVLTTGHGSEEAAVQALRLGFVDYIIKSSGYLFKLPGTLENAYQRDQLQCERSRLEQSEAKNRFQAELLRNAPVMAAFHDLDHKIVWVNRAYEEVAGLDLEDIAGKTCNEVWGLSDLCTGCPVKQAIDTGEKQKVELIPHNQADWIAKHGYWISYGAPVRDDRGEIIGAIEIAIDITERKKSEQERERLMTAIEQAGEIIAITDAKGAIEYVNPAYEKVTGYSSEESVGRTFHILHGDEPDDMFQRNLWATISSGGIWKGRSVNKRKNGELYTEASTISPVRNDLGNIVNYVAVTRDISDSLRGEQERAELQEQLQQAQKLESIGRLAGGVAHDFNNMLSVIIGYSEHIYSSLHTGDPLREDAREIYDAGMRSARLTRQLLAFSRKQTLQPEVVDLNALVHGLEKMLSRMIGEDIVLKLTLGTELGNVKVDSGQIEQVIMNLAVNSRDAMPQGGTLTIETVNAVVGPAEIKYEGIPAGEYVVLSVIDTGYGMDEAIRKQIFDPFFTTKEKERGTGLGLSTVYGIVKQSGGNIRVISEPGKGTTFKVYLPCIEEDLKAKPKKVEKEKRVAHGEHILLVEDDASLGRLCERILTNMGYRVTVATNGGEALLRVEEQGVRPDLVVTDVIMPGMSGTVLIERLRRTMPELKALYMSGYTDGAIVNQGVLGSGVPFIQKPFTVEKLSAEVHNLLMDGFES